MRPPANADLQADWANQAPVRSAAAAAGGEGEAVDVAQVGVRQEEGARDGGLVGPKIMLLEHPVHRPMSAPLPVQVVFAGVDIVVPLLL